MPYNIYGGRLERGHCEVHPDVHDEYPCYVCLAEEKERNMTVDEHCEAIGHTYYGDYHGVGVCCCGRKQYPLGGPKAKIKGRASFLFKRATK